MRLPGWHIQVEAVGLQVVALPVVRGLTEHILEPPLAGAEVCERQSDVALALVGRIVHHHQQPCGSRAVPGKGQKTIPGPVAVPGGDAVEQLPLALAHGRLA